MTVLGIKMFLLVHAAVWSSYVKQSTVTINLLIS